MDLKGKNLESIYLVHRLAISIVVINRWINQEQIICQYPIVNPF